MFETMHAFYAFFFPTLALIILGIVFEEKLVAFEQRVLAKLRGKTRQPAPARPALRRVERKSASRAAGTHTNRAA
ncbi:MAG: hypothetical protein IJL00_07135 [Clostridia bacterium]|nr:hypothetical protein [Clostridia bacterium]